MSGSRDKAEDALGELASALDGISCCAARNVRHARREVADRWADEAERFFRIALTMAAKDGALSRDTVCELFDEAESLLDSARSEASS